MRKLLQLGVALAMLWAGGSLAADNYPSRTINLYIGFPPGGGADTIARLVADQLSKVLNQAVVVHNRPGAETTIAAAHVANAPPDGYSLLLATDAVLGADKEAFSAFVNYDKRNFTPINRVASTFFVLAANNNLPVDGAGGLSEWAARLGQPVFIGSAGGVFMKMAVSEMNRSSGITFTEVPYKGGGPATTAVLANEVPLILMGPAAIMPLAREQKLKALGITSPQRSALLPDLPTLSEQGMKDLDVTVSWMLFGPAGMPAEIVQTLFDASTKVLNEESVKQRLATLGYEVAPLPTYQDVLQFAEREGARLRDRVKAVVEATPAAAGR